MGSTGLTSAWRRRTLVVGLVVAGLLFYGVGALLSSTHAKRAAAAFIVTAVCWAGALVVPLWGRVEGTRMRSVVMAHRLELSMTAALVVLSAICLAHFMRAMARAPLWNDELISILDYSSRGARVTVSSYSAPNNHIFLNLLNSLVPAAGSLDPLRERFWSMAAVGATVLLAVYEFFRRKSFLAGGVVVFAFAVNFNWLDEVLQDRGYGILAFCAMASSLWLWRYLETPRRRWLGALVIVTVIGTWTVPSFLFFAGPLWLLLLASERSRRIFVFGASALAAILLVYRRSPPSSSTSTPATRRSTVTTSPRSLESLIRSPTTWWITTTCRGSGCSLSSRRSW